MLAELDARGETLATAESLTGGLVGAAADRRARCLGELPRRRDQLCDPTEGNAGRRRRGDPGRARPGGRSERLRRWPRGVARRSAGRLGTGDHRGRRAGCRRTATRSARCTWPSAIQRVIWCGSKALSLAGDRGAIRRQAAVSGARAAGRCPGLEQPLRRWRNDAEHDLSVDPLWRCR